MSWSTSGPVDRRSVTGSPTRTTAAARAWYAFDHGAIRCVVLDTVNEHGGWQGSIGADQLAWLMGELRAAADRIVVLFSHHPLESLVNACRAPGASSKLNAAVALTATMSAVAESWFTSARRRS